VIVKYFCTSAGSNVAFSRSDRQRIVAGDGTMIRGWDAVSSFNSNSPGESVNEWLICFSHNLGT
jgi:hypothetical protein